MTYDRFEKQKQDILTKDDFSKKGFIDEKLVPIINYINSLNDHYTTSSCSGRILLIVPPVTGKKIDTKWLFSSHEKINFEDIDFTDLGEDPVYFRQESMIIHIACKDMDAAKKFLNLVRDAGFRRAGIIAISDDRVMLEIISSEQLFVPIAKNGKLLVDEDYLKYVVDIANSKLEKTFSMMTRLEKEIKEKL